MKPAFTVKVLFTLNDPDSFPQLSVSDNDVSASLTETGTWRVLRQSEDPVYRFLGHRALLEVPNHPPLENRIPEFHSSSFNGSMNCDMKDYSQQRSAREEV
jgi:hypothetical protein